MQGLKVEDGVLVKFFGDIKQALIPDHVLEIGVDAFEDCVSLNQIKLSKELTTIKENAFAGCDKLVRVIFPDTITTIEDNAFAGCSSLSSEALDFINSINPKAIA